MQCTKQLVEKFGETQFSSAENQQKYCMIYSHFWYMGRKFSPMNIALSRLLIGISVLLHMFSDLCKMLDRFE